MNTPNSSTPLSEMRDCAISNFKRHPETALRIIELWNNATTDEEKQEVLLTLSRFDERYARAHVQAAFQLLNDGFLTNENVTAAKALIQAEREESHARFIAATEKGYDEAVRTPGPTGMLFPATKHPTPSRFDSSGHNRRGKRGPGSY